MRRLTAAREFAVWKSQVRALLAEGAPPDGVIWQEAGDGQMLLLAESAIQQPAAKGEIRVPREYAELAEAVFYHSSSQRFWVLYRLVWRLLHGEPHLLEIDVDDDVRQARLFERQVRWDAHRMTGFVRFEKTVDAEGEIFVAWYQPDHHVLPLVTGSFLRRFRTQRWTILTPNASAHWDGRHLRLGPGESKRPATNDQLVKLWQRYYISTYNPQRDNPKLFRQHVPTRFLKDMPEGEAVARERRERGEGREH